VKITKTVQRVVAAQERRRRREGEKESEKNHVATD